MLKVEIPEGSQQSFLDSASKVDKKLHVEVNSQEHLVLISLHLSLVLLEVGLLELSKASEKEQVSLCESKGLVCLVAQEHIVKIGNSLKVFWSLSEINRDLVVT